MQYIPSKVIGSYLCTDRSVQPIAAVDGLAPLLHIRVWILDTKCPISASFKVNHFSTSVIKLQTVTLLITRTDADRFNMSSV
jgi:hypothetical protein